MEDERYNELVEILDERIDMLSKRHKFNISKFERLGLLTAVKIADSIGLDVTKSINQTILIIGLHKKYPNLDISYPFIYRN